MPVQVAELLEPCHLQRNQKAAVNSSSGAGDSMCQQQAETLLVLQQLSWLFTAMQAVLELYVILDANAASALKQGAVSLALDTLTTLADAPPQANPSTVGSSIHASSPAATPPAAAAAAQSVCTGAVLRLLAAPGQLQLPDSKQHEVLSVLRSVAERQEGLHVVLAGVLGNMGCAAKSGNPALQVCIVLHLSAECWDVIRQVLGPWQCECTPLGSHNRNHADTCPRLQGMQGPRLHGAPSGAEGQAYLQRASAVCIDQGNHIIMAHIGLCCHCLAS
jgi:hypothetical protein